MTRDEIINLAISAGFHFFDAGHAPMLHTTKANYSEEYFERFAALIAAAERAKLYAFPGAQQCKNCNGMGDRFDPSGEKIPCDLCESHLEEIRSLVAEAAHDIISGSDFWLSISLAAKKIYALHGAQNIASRQDEWKTLAKDLLREIERQTCAHEETHRGGFVWEICDSCGAKWADDEGGKPEFKWPKVVERAHAMLAAAPEAKP